MSHSPTSHNHEDERQAATQAFFQSLDELEHTLSIEADSTIVGDAVSDRAPRVSSPEAPPSEAELAIAAADIEQFLSQSGYLVDSSLSSGSPPSISP